MARLFRFVRKWLNALGLVLGIIGVAMVWRWGLPQPSFERGMWLAITGPVVEPHDSDVQALEAHFRHMSHLGFGLILAGFVCQLLNEVLPNSTGRQH
jgi:drug/metabolite transporter (DMT)-like permease